MNSTHDLGGMHGHGRIDRSQTVDFEHGWERRVFALTLACGMLGKWNLDESRHARETMDPGDYLKSSYYEHWLHGLEQLLLSKGLISKEELEAGILDGRTTDAAVPAEGVAEMLGRGGPVEMEIDRPAAFAVGDPVTARNFNPKSHTRSPRYVRGRRGVVTGHHGAHIFPDRHAATGEKVAEHLYSVRFEADEIWGPRDAEPGAPVYVDLFEPYLEPVR
ncbi:MAG: nitrile hydratase subunit beta [Gammaproteobacteria bacterium]|nr:nitrile hydratase subunit beta [Gammaproteobacteria bacterium]MYD75603.1 nitrile hydratase subunit beta [Gammaproteobacteria bacterium]MYJ53058.1 nitrile hydratase subunit beta [Gammaproteobacteria bacterium]